MADVLRSGGLVAVPTETVYGLAANALDPAACARVFEAKGRPRHDPFIVHVASRAAADQVAYFDPAAEKLAARFWPGPLTLVLPKRSVIPAIVTAGRATVAVRVPAHPLLRRLLERCTLPLAAPSANPFGYVSPTSAAHVLAGLAGKVDHILDGGPCAVGLESTIVDTRKAREPVILRPGGVSHEAIEAELGCKVRLHARKARNPADHLNPPGELAPGMLDRHYSPRTPMELRDRPFAEGELSRLAPDVAALCLAKPPRLIAPTRALRWLSASGDLAEAARNLFATLRELDAGGFSRIICEPAPNTGLGLAINDRLHRAAAPDERGQ